MNYNAKDIIKRDWYKSYSEFFFTLALGRVLHMRGHTLDMSDMKVDPDILPQDLVKYYKTLLQNGEIFVKGFKPEESVMQDIAEADVDISYFREVPLYVETGMERHWDVNHAVTAYGKNSDTFCGGMRMGTNLLHLVAWHIVDILEGSYRGKLTLSFDKFKTKNTYLYVNVYSCMHTLLWLEDYIGITLDLDDCKVDLEYSIFCNNALVSKHYKHYSISEKAALIEKYDMKVGSILVLYTRDGICKNNKTGRIVESSIIRLDEIGDDYLGITKISVNKTKEEINRDYEEVDEDKRSMFADILDYQPNMESTEISLYDIGVDCHFYDEPAFICKLDFSARTKKLITIAGKEVVQDMSEIDTIYWLFCQYGIEFDKELYISMYYQNQTPLWEQCN